MLTVQEAINEVDALVPNTFDVPKKVGWLNTLNKEFFEVVQIPAIHQFVTTAGQSTYPVNTKIMSHKVDSVRVGSSFYESMQYEDVQPGHNHWIIDDAIQELSLYPPSAITGERGVLKYTKLSATTFTTGSLTAVLEAPKEYHWAYVLGLAERVAKAMNDVTLANNYGNDYRSQLLLAQQNFGNRQQREG